SRRGAGLTRTRHRGFAAGSARPRRRRIVPAGTDQGSLGLADDDKWRAAYPEMHSAAGREAEAVSLATDDRHQPPYLPTMPRQTASRSMANDSLPTLALFATAVITITSLSSGSTKTDWP